MRAPTKRIFVLDGWRFSMIMVFRRAEVRDIPYLIALNDAFNGHGATVDSMKDSLMNSKCEIVFIATADDTVIGFTCGLFWQSICYSEGLQGIIMELYVHENYRRNGIATKLIRALEHEFRSLHVREITLVTPVTNTVGRMFYESQGYTDEKEMKYQKVLCTE